MADRTEGSIVIQADPSAIMKVITDFEAYPDWADFQATEVRERDDGGRATLVYFELSAGPINARYSLSYNYRDGNSGIEWSFAGGTGVRNIEGEYLLEAEGAATKVTYRTSAELGIPIPGFLKRQGEKRIIDTALKGLKKRVERSS